MARLTSLTVIQLLDALAANEPLPAGGSAAALAGAAGASLLLMAATLPVKAEGADPAVAAALAGAAAQLQPIRRTLIELVDRDTDAYARVIEARRLPRTTPAEQEWRRRATASAMRGATEAPLDTMRASRGALGLAAAVAAHAPRSASADVAVALELLAASVRGAGRSVGGNLPFLTDEPVVQAIDDERTRLESESEADAARARAAL